MELSEFDIKYEPRGPIKGQIFADFVVELSSEATRVEGDDFRWVLSVDGSSNQQGSGAGVILEGPNGVLIDQSLRFAFKASNNQAEYEALIAGILLAKEMGAKVLVAKSDSVGHGTSNRRVSGQGSTNGGLPGVCAGVEGFLCLVRCGACTLGAKCLS